MNRRGFLSVITMGAVAVPAAAMGVKASSNPSDAPISGTTLSIKNGVKKSNNSSVFFEDQYEEYKTVNMSVGKDGNLWIKTEDGQWKRIVTE
jgi:hypothetical protein